MYSVRTPIGSRQSSTCFLGPGPRSRRETLIFRRWAYITHESAVGTIRKVPQAGRLPFISETSLARVPQPQRDRMLGWLGRSPNQKPSIGSALNIRLASPTAIAHAAPTFNFDNLMNIQVSVSTDDVPIRQEYGGSSHSDWQHSFFHSAVVVSFRKLSNSVVLSVICNWSSPII